MKQLFTHTHIIVLSLLISLPLLSGSALARETSIPGTFFMGLAYGRPDVEMQTRFTRDISGTVIEDSRFDNSYTANAGGIFLGYTLPWKRAYLSTQVFFNTVHNAFELSAGSSRYTNEMNQAIGLDFMPGIYIYKGISLFGKIGWIRGDFDFIKSSPTSTTYDIDTDLDGLTLGCGVAWDISPRVTLKLGYERQSFKDEDIRASLDVMNDRTRVEPRAETVFFTVQYNFTLR